MESKRKRKKPSHGLYKTRIFRIWIAMRERCNYPNHQNYDRYGGRGITVCDEWRKSVVAFRDWAMANGYRDDLTIERLDNDKGYSPDNCTFIPGIHQARNRSSSKITIEIARRMRKAAKAGATIRAIADSFEVPWQLVYRVVKDKCWREQAVA